MFTYHQSRLHFLIFVVFAICTEARNFAMPNVGNSWENPSHSYTKNSCASLSLKNLDKSATFFPWMARLNFPDGSYCTATIVSQNYLLTAGHCAEKYEELGGAYALLGSANAENAQRHQVVPEESIKHPGYTHDYLGNPINDIALLKLTHPLKFDYVKTAPICLAGGKVTQTEGTIAGWGQNQLPKQCPDPFFEKRRVPQDDVKIMGSGQVKIVPVGSHECPSFTGKRNLDAKMLCTVHLNAVADQGDSGGPLMVQKGAGDGWQQIGVTSFVAGCHKPKPMPVGYTSIRHYCDWIAESTDGEVKCVD